MLAERQANAQTLDGTRGVGIHTMKTLENARKLIAGDADAVVMHGDLQPRRAGAGARTVQATLAPRPGPGSLQADADLAAGRRALDSVRQQLVRHRPQRA